MVTTVRGRRPLPDGTMADDNIIVWTNDPAGDWSEPVVLIEVRPRSQTLAMKETKETLSWSGKSRPWLLKAKLE